MSMQNVMLFVYAQMLCIWISQISTIGICVIGILRIIIFKFRIYVYLL